MRRLSLQWRAIGCGLVLLTTLYASGDPTTSVQLSPSPSTISFGSIPIGTTSTQSETLTNTAGSDMKVSQVTLVGAGFTITGLNPPLTLTAGQSLTFSVVFTPQSTAPASGTISLVCSAPSYSSGSGQIRRNGSLYTSTTTISLSGTGVASAVLAANPSSIAFGDIPVGSSKTQSATISNQGGSSVTISQASTTGSGFGVWGLSLPMTLAAGQNATFSVTFAPSTSGTATGQIAIASNTSNTAVSLPLSGTATAAGQLSVSPTAIGFGNVVVGTIQSQTGTLTATGASVTVSSAGISGSEFSMSGLSLPLTLAAGQSASYAVTFTPQMSGTASANLSFVSNASNTSTVESLSGNGTAPPQHSVALSWNASTSVVVGYNIYRGGQSGGPYTRINSTLEGASSYTDSTVQAGQTYCYVTTAVDSVGAESGYSNEVSAVIPTP